MTLEDIQKQIDNLRSEILFGQDGSGSECDKSCATPFAEQAILSGLAFLELARIQFRIAEYSSMQKL